MLQTYAADTLGSPSAGDKFNDTSRSSSGASLDFGPLGNERVDVIDCHRFDGPGGTFVVDCEGRPYSYCVLNQNDGNGDHVFLGVREQCWDKIPGLPVGVALHSNPMGPLGLLKPFTISLE